MTRWGRAAVIWIGPSEIKHAAAAPLAMARSPLVKFTQAGAELFACGIPPLGARRVDGIFPSDFEQGEIGPDLFRHACLMGLEGMVSKHRDRPYRAGRSPYWVKVKNRQHPAFSRVMEQI